MFFPSWIDGWQRMLRAIAMFGFPEQVYSYQYNRGKKPCQLGRKKSTRVSTRQRTSADTLYRTCVLRETRNPGKGNFFDGSRQVRALCRLGRFCFLMFGSSGGRAELFGAGGFPPPPSVW
jgi:hypothetical protein